MSQHETIHYLEVPSRDLPARKAFFSTVFGLTFTDYGPEYTAFSYAAEQAATAANEFAGSTNRAVTESI
ncbi:hypothetical protein NYF23_05360 [SAR92 clade bacterium H455]|uniref:VOC family protein n=1 Tax=SAR92 clade bacterium H455 TaxID=2974818 RepID=A0ABY5TQD5_9GAMM|nr:hypothetical protein NYF23_05360 [SAR92 clade bacterium H455]